MLQQLDLASELESDLWGTVDRKWLVDFNAQKITLVLLMWKWMGLFLEEKSSIKMLGLYFSSKLDWGSTFAFAKAASKKIGVLIGSMKFFSLFVALNSLKTL